MDIEEALDEFRAEYESSEHWGSDLIISLECAEVISAELDKKDKIINLMAEDLMHIGLIPYRVNIFTKEQLIEQYANKVEEDIKE